MEPKTGHLEHVPINRVQRNEHNPRLIFRPDELEGLADSIQEIGVQVPISVYKDGRMFTLIDGERRWRACRMLNLTVVPAIIYPKPDAVQNIVFMFNIHRFRKDWDPLPTAMKLEELRKLVAEQQGRQPTEAQFAALTGMSQGQVRRCKLIMEIPESDRLELLDELEKPENERQITTDLYVECQRSVRTIRTYTPDLEDLEDPLRDALIEKYKQKVITNVTHMRQIAKIARAVSKGVSKRTVSSALNRLIEDETYSTEDAYQRVAWVYDIRTVGNQAKSLSELLESLEGASNRIDAETTRVLRELRKRINTLLK